MHIVLFVDETDKQGIPRLSQVLGDALHVEKVHKKHTLDIFLVVKNAIINISQQGNGLHVNVGSLQKALSWKANTDLVLICISHLCNGQGDSHYITGFDVNGKKYGQCSIGGWHQPTRVNGNMKACSVRSGIIAELCRLFADLDEDTLNEIEKAKSEGNGTD